MIHEMFSRLFEIGADGVAEKQPYYIHWPGGNEQDVGLTYCRDCCETEWKKLKILYPDREFYVAEDHGDVESTLYCDFCGARLYSDLLVSGCREEVDHYIQYGFSFEPDECLDLYNVIKHCGDDDCISKRLHRLYGILFFNRIFLNEGVVL